MTSVELKSSIHKIVDQIESEQLLQTIYEFLKLRDKHSSRAWDTLTDEQKQELLLSFEESEDEANLIEASKIFRRKG